MKSNFLKNFFMTSAGNILVVVFGLINSIIITRWLGPENKGIYTVVMNIVLFFNLLLGEGLRRSNTLIVAENQNNLRKLLRNNLFSLIVIILVGLLFIGLNEIFKITDMFKIEPVYLFVAISISAFSVMWLAMQAIFLGLKDIYHFNVLLVSATLGILILDAIGIFVFSFGLNLIFVNIFVIYFVIFIASFRSLFSKARKTKGKSDFNFTKQIILSFKSTLANLEIFLTKRSSVFFLSNLLNSASVGIFSVALIFSDMFQRFPNVAGTLIFSNTANKDLSIVEQTAKVVRIITFFLLIVVIGIILIGKFLIILLFGKTFSGAYEPLLALSFGLIFFGVGTVIHSYYMGKGFPIKILYLNLLVTILSLISNYFLIKEFAILGAGLSMSIVISVWSFAYLFLFTYETKTKVSEVLIIKKNDLLELSDYFGKIIIRKR